MADYTSRLNLKKPARTDYYSVEDQNSNMDILDEHVVIDTDKATTEEAEVGTDDTKWMTPAKTKESIESNGIYIHADNKKYLAHRTVDSCVNPVSMTVNAAEDPHVPPGSSGSMLPCSTGRNCIFSQVVNGDYALTLINDGIADIVRIYRTYKANPKPTLVTNLSAGAGANSENYAAICKSKTDPDLAYIVYNHYASTIHTAYLSTIKISTGGIISTVSSNSATYSTASVAPRMCIDTGDSILIYTLDDGGTNGDAFTIYIQNKLSGIITAAFATIGSGNCKSYLMGVDTSNRLLYVSTDFISTANILKIGYKNLTSMSEGIILTKTYTNSVNGRQSYIKGFFNESIGKWFFYIPVDEATAGRFMILSWDGTSIDTISEGWSNCVGGTNSLATYYGNRVAWFSGNTLLVADVSTGLPLAYTYPIRIEGVGGTIEYSDPDDYGNVIIGGTRPVVVNVNDMTVKTFSAPYYLDEFMDWNQYGIQFLLFKDGTAIRLVNTASSSTPNLNHYRIRQFPSVNLVYKLSPEKQTVDIMSISEV